MSGNDTPLNLAVIVSSTRGGRFATTVSHWLTEHIKQRPDFALDVIDLAEIRLPSELPAYGEAPSPQAAEALSQLTPRLAQADAFIVITPEYNHSFPAPLKNAIDWHNREWHAKPVGFVSYGGLSGGLRAVEQLRVVFAELHAVTIRDTLSFHNAGAAFGPDGTPLDATGTDGATKVLLDRLAWWGLSLREAKEARPYDG